MAIRLPLVMLEKRGDASSTTSSVDQTTSTTTTKKSHTFTLPASFAPLTSTEAATTSTEDPADYSITIYEPLPTSTTTQNSNIAMTTDGAPQQFSHLLSRAPNEVTRTKLYDTWTATYATATSTASASASASAVPAKTYSGLNGGQLAGVIVGSIAGGIFFIYMFYVMCWSRRKALRKAREEREMREKTRKNAVRASAIDLKHFAYDSDEELEEKDYTYHDDNQPISLPRTQPRYDPNRVYNCTSDIHDPKEDFKSYYRPSPSNSSGSSVSGSGSGTPLNVYSTAQPFYGGFNPIYGPMMQPQSPAFVNMNSSGRAMSCFVPQPFIQVPMSAAPSSSPPPATGAATATTTVPVSEMATGRMSMNSQLPDMMRPVSGQYFGPDAFYPSPMAGFYQPQPRPFIQQEDVRPPTRASIASSPSISNTASEQPNIIQNELANEKNNNPPALTVDESQHTPSSVQSPPTTSAHTSEDNNQQL